MSVLIVTIVVMGAMKLQSKSMIWAIDISKRGREETSYKVFEYIGWKKAV